VTCYIRYKGTVLPQYLLRVSDKNHTDSSRPKDSLEPRGDAIRQLAEKSQGVTASELGPVLPSTGKTDLLA
jgi:hypothetical protein